MSTFFKAFDDSGHKKYSVGRYGFTTGMPTIRKFFDLKTGFENAVEAGSEVPILKEVLNTVKDTPIYNEIKRDLDLAQDLEETFDVLGQKFFETFDPFFGYGGRDGQDDQGGDPNADQGNPDNTSGGSSQAIFHQVAYTNPGEVNASIL